MKKSRFSESQIIAAIKQAENGQSVSEICREMEISTATFHGWRTKFGSPKRQTKPGGKAGALMTRLKELEAENVRLKKMQMQESIKAQMLKEAQG